MLNRWKTIALRACAAASVVLGACSSSVVEPAVRDGPGPEVTATRVGDHIVIRNAATRPVLFASLDRNFFQTALASYCFGNNGCGTKLNASDSASVLTADIDGVTPSSQDVIVFWWYVVPVPQNQSGTMPVVREIIVPLH